MPKLPKLPKVKVFCLFKMVVHLRRISSLATNTYKNSIDIEKTVSLTPLSVYSAKYANGSKTSTGF
jgi:hypothetical protein